MAFTAKDVQALREKTGCGMMDCKKALTESNGDMEKAVDLLREKGLAAAAKKSGRIAAEGLVLAVTNDTGNIGAVVEVNSETDFVAKNADFQNFVDICAKTVINENPADVDTFLTLKAGDTGLTVDELLKEKILTIGENLKIRRFVRYEGKVVPYVHGGGRIGVLVNLDADSAVADKPEIIEIGKDVAMQIAALNATFLDKASVPADVIEKEKEILIAQIKNDEKFANKPEAIIEKMVEGKISKFFENNCLLQQSFVKDGSLTVEKYLAEKSKELGGNITVKAFTRFEKGEGLQKREDNFADEVASMIK